MKATGLIGFGDADAFYSSAEYVRRPWLRGVPLGVLGNQGACVIARSYSMKKYGVKVGEPIWEARVKCPNGVYVKRDFRWYESLSRKMLAELGAISPKREYYSIDEFFWEAEPVRRTWQETAEATREHIKNRVGIPMTVAYARTRTLAKLFADTAKPNGAVAVTDRNHERDLLGKLPVKEIAGIGSRREATLLRYGIKTCLDFANANGILIRKLLTVVGHDLWLELNGIKATPIRPTRTPHKMIARGGSLAGKVNSPLSLYGWLVRNVERLIEELHFHQVRTRALALHVSYFEDDGGHGIVHLNVPTDRFDVLLEAAKVGLRQAWRQGRAATHMHLIATELVSPGAWQRSLFDPPDDGRAEVLAKLKHEVNERFGRFRLRSGATLFANEFYEDQANEYDVCDIHDKFCF